MLAGHVPLPWWGYIIVALTFTHITIAAVTIYLHRHQAHRAVDLHPAVANFFRFWLWLTTGLQTKEWVAVHRKHHARVETPDDPHSPQIFGIRKVLFEGVELYREAVADPEILRQYGHGTPDDWFERHIFTSLDSAAGIGAMLVIDLVLFGPVGLTIWAVQMIWIPFFAAGVINGVAHWRGYRNFETPDAATNISPWGILIGGEELHNNHHAFASSARFSNRAWEFDIGWWYIRMFAALRLATVKKVALAPIIDGRKQRIDVDTLSAVITHQFHVMADYARDVVKKVHREEVQNAAKEIRSLLRPTKRLLTREERLMSEQQRWTLKRGLSYSRTLTVVYEYRRKLQEIFADRHASAETLIGRLQEWCGAAEQTGIAALSDFAATLHGYTLKSAAV